MELLAGLHEKIVHFPIALLIVYPLVELIAIITKKDFFSKTAMLFLFIGVVAALGAVLTGNQSFTFNEWSDEAMSIFQQHEINANITTWLFTALLVFRYFLVARKKLDLKFHLLILFISFAGIYFVYNTGSYGGELAKQKIKDAIIKDVNTNHY